MRSTDRWTCGCCLRGHLPLHSGSSRAPRPQSPAEGAKEGGIFSQTLMSVTRNDKTGGRKGRKWLKIRKFASIISHYEMNSGGIKAVTRPLNQPERCLESCHAQRAERMPNGCLGPWTQHTLDIMKVSQMKHLGKRPHFSLMCDFFKSIKLMASIRCGASC